MKIKVIDLKKIKNKYEIIFSNDDKLVANEDLVLKYRLVKDKELELDVYKQARIDSVYYDFYQMALTYLSRGQKSQYKMKTYLISKGCDVEAAEFIIIELSRKKLLNDYKYMEMLVSHYSKKGYGPLYIKQKGNQESIDSLIIDECIHKIPDDEYLEYAIALIVKQNKIYSKKFDTFKKNQKLKSYLLSRGYSYDIINKALKEI